VTAPQPLPLRSPMPWLPSLRGLVTDDPLWAYQGGVTRLRVWEAGDGHFAVVTELGGGIPVSSAVRAIWAQLSAWYGPPLGLAEYWPAGLDGPEHADLVVPGGVISWLPLWPVRRGSMHAEVRAAWWAAYGDQILSRPGT
jgi:hypothetical protein